MNNRKGEGCRTSNQLNAEQKVKLTLWIAKQDADTKFTYEELAEVATTQLGFVVVPSNVQTTWVPVHGPRRIRSTSSLAELEKRVGVLEKKFTELGL